MPRAAAVLILKGIRFGLLLQFAIGPMGLMVFNTAAASGFGSGMELVMAIALIDALYIGLAGAGIAAVVNKAKTYIKAAGSLVLVLFGANTAASVFNVSFLPGMALFSNSSSTNLFGQGLLLTASNPLTIVFWSGMLSAQIIENKWNNRQLFFFAVGCVLATVIFLTIVAFLSSVLGSFLPQIMVQCLNVVVGLVLICFGIKLLCKKEKVEATDSGF